MKNSFSKALTLVAIIWAIFLLDAILPMDFNQYGIIPRTSGGLIGIIFSPFLHGNLGHILSNTIPLLILTTVLFWFYKNSAFRVLVLSALLGGILVWIFARSASHIGASGVIFALVAFLIASGVFRKKIKPLIIAIIIFFFYGGVIWGVLPSDPRVSWEGHLFGFLSGIALAWVYKSSEK